MPGTEEKANKSNLSLSQSLQASKIDDKSIVCYVLEREENIHRRGSIAKWLRGMVK